MKVLTEEVPVYDNGDSGLNKIYNVRLLELLGRMDFHALWNNWN